jgi:hypothetical protein
MRFFIKFIGLVFLLVGIYFLGQNIIFTTNVSPFWWRDLSAAGSVLALTAGIIFLVFFRRAVGQLGWVLVGLGIMLVFVSGRVMRDANQPLVLLPGFCIPSCWVKARVAGRLEF